MTVWSLNNISFEIQDIKVYLKFTCNSSSLAQLNILQLIFSWTSALLLHKMSSNFRPKVYQFGIQNIIGYF